MHQTTKSLDYGDIKARIQSAGEGGLRELYEFGQVLIDDAVERLSKSDGKAANLAAFSGGIITIALSTSPVWIRFASRPFAYAALLGVFAFFVGALLAVNSIYPQATEWYSENDWLRSECLQKPETMLRYRVLTMWRVVTSHHAAFRKKTETIKRATLVVGLGMGALFVALLNVIWRYSSL